MQEFFITLLQDFALILGEMSPYLLLGFFFAGLLKAFIPQHKIERYFNANNIKSPFLAALFGVPLPLCSCGVIPTGAALYKNGASKSSTVSFLISTPQTGVDSIMATYALMGLPFAIIRPIAALITGIGGGVLTGMATKDEPAEVVETTITKTRSLKEKIGYAFKYGFVEFVQDISKWLVIGLIIAAIISAAIPDDFIYLQELHPALQMGLILIISIPLYICATGSIPLAAVLIMKGISPGAAFVLLMAGPATNAATITMIGKVLGKKSLAIYLSTIIIGAVATGLIIDYLLPAQWFNLLESGHLHHEHGTPWWHIASGVVMTGLIIYGYIAKKKKLSIPNIENMETIKVEGMTCNHCKSNVETNLEKLDFITSAKVDLASKTVNIEGVGVDMEKVKNTINDLGYKC